MTTVQTTVRSRMMAVLLGLAIAVVGLPVMAGSAQAWSGEPDVSFNTNVGASMVGPAHTVAVQPDGKVVVGGMLLGQSKFLMRFNADGTPDVAFNTAVADVVTSPVFSVVVQPDGKIVTAGILKPPILRLNPDGSLDQDFFDAVNLDWNDGVLSLAVQPDGKILAGGLFTSPSNHLARFNADGTPDADFNTSVGTALDNWVRAVAVQSDNKIVVGGLFEAPSHYLARFNADGTPDADFNTSVGTTLGDWVLSAAIQPDGKIVTGGLFRTPSRFLARINPDGTPDQPFNTAVGTTLGSRVESVAVQPDGKLVVGGRFKVPTTSLARFKSDGTPDTGFNTTVGNTLNQPVNSLALQADGMIVVGGEFTSTSNSLARFEGVDPTPPAAPENLMATPGYTSAVVDFDFGSDGRSPVTGVEFSVDAGANWVATGSTDPQVRVEGLPNGVATEVLIRAVNEVGPGAEAGVSVTPQGAVFSGLTSSFRAFDSRPSQGGAGPLTPGVSVAVDVQAPDGAVAVAYNLTLVDTVDVGHVAMGPAGADLTGTSTANWFASGQRWANAYVSGVDEAGMVQLVARGAPVQAIVDVTGFYLADGSTVPVGEPAAGPAAELEAVVLPAATQDSLFVPVPPTRAYDSRGIDGAIASGQERTIDLGPWVPEGATGVAYTLTVTDTVDVGHLSVGVPGGGKPATSVINWFATGQNVANSATGAVDVDRAISVFAGGGPTQFVIDILGYFTPVAPPAGQVGTAKNGEQGLRFTAIDPSRAYDSRGADGPIAGGQSRTTTVLPASGQVPPGVGAVAFNLTETDTAGRGHLRVAPGGSPIPAVSTINWYSDGMRLANGSVVDVAHDQLTTFARATTGGGTNYIVDIGGYYN